MSSYLDRKILKITGADRRTFLQGLITNNVDKLDHGLVYAALLTPQGKYIADFLLFERDGAIFLDVDTSLAAHLMMRLSMYKLRSDVQIAETDKTVTAGTGPKPDGAFDDPRHTALGWRGYGVGQSDSTDWDALRVAHVIPQTGIELSGESYILECGFERLNGVDFRKGCYVGQEVTARMKHKTELRKGLYQVTISGHAPVGTAIMANEKEVGTLLTQSGDHAIAYLRLDRAGENMTAGDARILNFRQN